MSGQRTLSLLVQSLIEIEIGKHPELLVERTRFEKASPQEQPLMMKRVIKSQAEAEVAPEVTPIAKDHVPENNVNVVSDRLLNSLQRQAQQLVVCPKVINKLSLA